MEVEREAPRLADRLGPWAEFAWVSNTLLLWKREETGVWESEKIGEHKNWLNCLQVLADGRIVSGSDDGTIRIWDEEARK